MKIKMKDVLANKLSILLASISRDKLVPEDASFDVKCKAMSKRRAILRTITDANDDFKKNVTEKIDAVLKSIEKEWKEVSAEIDSLEAKTDEEKKAQAKEKTKKEDEINERLNKKVKDLGFALTSYRAMPGIQFVQYVDSKNEVDVTLELDEKHGHREFLLDQLEKNISKLGIPDDVVLDLVEALK